MQLGFLDAFLWRVLVRERWNWGSYCTSESVGTSIVDKDTKVQACNDLVKVIAKMHLTEPLKLF